MPICYLPIIAERSDWKNEALCVVRHQEIPYPAIAVGPVFGRGTLTLPLKVKNALAERIRNAH
jgi:hypothetical protein